MRYHDLPGKGMPILFIHGLGCAGTFDYPEVAAQDSLKNHRCILVDLLGAGCSDKRLDFGERSLPDPDVQILAEDGIKIEMVKRVIPWNGKIQKGWPPLSAGEFSLQNSHPAR